MLIDSRGERRTVPAVVPAPAVRARELVTVGAATEPQRVVGRHAAYAPGASGGGFGTRVGGHVRDADGRVLPGAALTLIDLGGHQIDRACTRSDGSYTLAVPGAGSYMLIAAADGRQPHAATVVVGGEALAFDLTLSDGSGLAGVVRDAALNPVADAMVVVTDVRGEVVAATSTSPDGGFTCDDLLTGMYVVAVSAPGHRPNALTIQVTGQATTRCEIELRAGVRVGGEIRAGDRPVADARVTLVDPAGNVVATAQSDPDGAYVFDDLDPGPYTVIASGYPPVAAALHVGTAGEPAFGLTLGYPDDHRGEQE